MLENSTIQIQIKQMCKASYNLAAFYQTNGVHKKWTQVVKSIGHKFLNTQYKNKFEKQGITTTKMKERK